MAGIKRHRKTHAGPFGDWEEGMTRMKKLAAGLLSASAMAFALPAASQANELTLCWAAWDPANALVELSKDFEAQSGVKMNFIPAVNSAMS